MRAIHIRTFPRLIIIGALLAVAVLLTVITALVYAADAPSGFSATAGDTQVTLTWNDPNDTTITGYQVLQVAIDKLVGGSSVTSDRFGDSVGVDNNRAVVGAPREESVDQDIVITDGGLGHTFRRASGVWSGDGSLSLSTPQVNGRLGSSVAVAGSTAVIGAPSYTQSNNNDPGRFFIASKSSGISSWTTEFTATGQSGNDLFGYSVALAVALDTGIAHTLRGRRTGQFLTLHHRHSGAIGSWNGARRGHCR